MTPLLALLLICFYIANGVIGFLLGLIIISCLCISLILIYPKILLKELEPTPPHTSLKYLIQPWEKKKLRILFTYRQYQKKYHIFKLFGSKTIILSMQYLRELDEKNLEEILHEEWVRFQKPFARIVFLKEFLIFYIKHQWLKSFYEPIASNEITPIQLLCYIALKPFIKK